MQRRRIADLAGPSFRLARAGEEDAIDELMKLATRELFPLFYDADQTASSVRYVAVVDQAMVEDGTYFVGEVEGALVACGGWSRRDKLYSGSGAGEDDARLLDPATEPARVRAMFVHPEHTRRGLGTRILELCEEAAKAEGFKQLSLLATLAGVPLYRRYGFEVLEEVEVALADGVLLGCAAMEKPIA